MFSVLLDQCVNDRLIETGEAVDVATKAALECGDRIIGTPGSVIGALDGGGGKRDVQARRWMAPNAFAQPCQFTLQFSGLGRRGQQRSDDREAQTGEGVTLGGVLDG